MDKKQKLNKNVIYSEIMLVIHPTQFQDYDILAIGDVTLLKHLAYKNKSFHLIKRSKFGGIPILILDTCDTLKQTMNCIKQYRKGIFG